MLRLHRCVVASVLLFVAVFAYCQAGPVAAPPAPQVQTDAQKYVASQFGPAFTVLPNFPVLTGDLDEDGAEDTVFVATAKNPLLDEVAFHYKTIDPYNSYFGFGDPHVTMQFAAQEGEPRFLLVVHGWKLDAPKAKFVVINVPFEKMGLDRIALKKKVVPAIALEDRTKQKSTLFWTGKQWKWTDQSEAAN